MIIQRLSQGIKNQDWFVVMVEVMIVVVGIFIGLQVDDWNEERNNRVLERSYYQQLILDLKTDQKFANGAIIDNRRDYARGELLNKALTDDDFQISDPNAFADSVMTAGYLTRALITRQTYDELTNTGNLRLLVDVALKREIVGYYELTLLTRQWDMLQSNVQTLFWEEAAGLITLEVVHKLRSEEKLTVSPEEARKILYAARAAPKLKGLLVQHLKLQSLERLAAKGIIRRSQHLIELLEKKLEDTK